MYCTHFVPNPMVTTGNYNSKDGIFVQYESRDKYKAWLRKDGVDHEIDKRDMAKIVMGNGQRLTLQQLVRLYVAQAKILKKLDEIGLAKNLVIHKP